MRIKNNRMTQAIYVLVEDEVREKLRREAFEKKTSQAEIVRMAIDQYFATVKLSVTTGTA